VLALKPLKPHQLLRTAQFRFCRLHQGEKESQMAPAQLLYLSGHV
jgi:hypothetical protein